MRHDQQQTTRLRIARGMSGPMTESEFNHVEARAWASLIHGIISVALSDHPVIAKSRTYRHMTNRASEALFDLCRQLDRDMNPSSTNVSSGTKRPGTDGKGRAKP